MSSSDERMVPAVGGRNPVRRLKQVVLPGAIRANQADDLTLLNGEIDAIDRGESAEVLAEVARPSSGMGQAVGTRRLRRRVARPQRKPGELARERDHAAGQKQNRE